MRFTPRFIPPHAICGPSLDPPEDPEVECDGCGYTFPAEELARIILPDGSNPLWCEDCAYRAAGLAELLSEAP